MRLSAFGSPRSRIVAELEKCEQDLKATGLPWTILKPTFFMQNLMMSAPTISERGAIYYDWADGRAGMIDVRDIVDCAVAALTGQAGAVEGETFILTGPAAIGFADVAAILSRVTGRTIQYVPVPHEAASETMLSMACRSGSSRATPSGSPRGSPTARSDHAPAAGREQGAWPPVRPGRRGCGWPHVAGGGPNSHTPGTAIEAAVTCWEASPMSPTDITIVHASAVHSVRVSARRIGRRR